MNNNYKDRKVDKLKVPKSKQYLWKYIKEKQGLGMQTAKKKSKKPQKGFGAILAEIFMPKRIAWASVVAVLVIIAVVVGPNLQNLLTGDGIIETPTVSANFEMTADSEDSAGVDSDSSFTLTASEDIDSATIEAILKVTPDADINVTKTGEGKYKVSTAQNMEANTVYVFSIEGETEEFSWAYQVKDTFKVTGTLPYDKASGIPVDTGIEFYLSHEGFNPDDAYDYFDIAPHAGGHFEKHLKTLSFVPEGGLKTGTLYTATLKAGFPLAGSDQVLAEDKVIHFETSATSGEEPKFRFTNTVYEIGPDQSFAFYIYNNQAEGRDDDREFNYQINVFDLGNEDNYISALQEKQEIPNWARWAKQSHFLSTDGYEKISTVEALGVRQNYRDILYIPDMELDPGYYIFESQKEDGRTQALVQVTNLASYIALSKNKSIIWVNNVSKNAPVGNAKVEILETNQNITTDGEGISIFDFPLPEDNEEHHATFKITSPENETLITELRYVNQGRAFFTAGDYWELLETDRPMYQPKDTMYFWGFIQPRKSQYAIEDMRVELFGNGVMIDNDVKFEMETDNTFFGSVELENVPAGWYTLDIYDGDQYITGKSFNVETYVKPTYQIETTTDKQAIFVGETVKYDFKTSFFDGTPVPDMPITSKDFGDFTTDAQGKHSIEKTITVDDITGKCGYDYCSNVRNYYTQVTPKLGEESSITSESTIRVFYSKINVDGSTKSEGTKATVNAKLNWIDLSRLNNDETPGYNDYLSDPVSGREVKGEITEYWWEKQETGEYYDYINKKVVKEYKWNKQEKPFGEFTITTDGKGEASYQFEMTPERHYKVKLTAFDNDGKDSERAFYAYAPRKEYKSDYYRIDVMNGDENYPITFDLKERAEFAIVQDQNPIDEEGKFLFMVSNNGLIEYQVKNSPTFSLDMSNNHIPSAMVRGVWFNGNKFIDAWPTTVKANVDFKKLNVEVTSDKDSYKPGDDVTLKVNVKDQNGRGVKSQVLFSLVDEAYYQLIYDNFVDPLDKLYESTGEGIVGSYSSHKNAEAAMDGGMGGCFTGDTQILMADETYKAIKDIKAGDRILTKLHPYTDVLVSAPVTQTFEHFVNEYLVINEHLEVTGVHNIFVNNKWTTADKINIGDVIYDKYGNEINVESIRKIVTPVYVYNFEVEKYHTYFANDIYVHNDKGGGVRDEFEDTALYRTISTDGSGNGQVQFTLPDNITSWRIVATALNPDELMAGASTENLQVTLPLFGDLVMNKEYSVKDDPIIGMRAFGTNLEGGDEVKFNISSDSFEDSGDIMGEAFKTTYFDLPDLAIGTHTIQLDTIANRVKDALAEDINIRGSRLKDSVVELVNDYKEGDTLPLPEEGYAKVYLMNAGVSNYYGGLLGMFYTEGERIDQKLSTIAASEILNKYFDESFMPDFEFDSSQYQQSDGGISLLPYSDSDLRLTALITAFDTNKSRFNKAALKGYFEKTYKNTDSNLDEIVLSMLGLASIQEPVLNSLRAIKDEPKLSLVDKLHIALAFERIGSKNEALEMFNEIKGELDYKNTYATAIGANIAASLQLQDDAMELWRYVYVYELEDDIANLYFLGFTNEMLKFVNSDPEVKFDLRAGNVEEKDITLTKCQRYPVLVHAMKGMSIVNLEGDLAAVVQYDKTVEPADFPTDNRVNISRSYVKADGTSIDSLQVGDIVHVKLDLRQTSETPEGVYKIVDILPSGLRPLAVTGPYRNYGAIKPWRVHNQEMHFYWGTEWEKPGISYYAKVIHPGEFYADPAKIEYLKDDRVANISKSSFIKIEQ